MTKPIVCPHCKDRIWKHYCTVQEVRITEAKLEASKAVIADMRTLRGAWRNLMRAIREARR